MALSEETRLKRAGRFRSFRAWPKRALSATSKSGPVIIRRAVMPYIRFPLSLRNVEDLLDEVFVKINGETHYLWRAVGHEGEVLESFVTKRRDSKAALKLRRKLMKRFGSPQVIVTDKLRSCGAAMKAIGNVERQEAGRWLNSRAENSHLPIPRRERAMLRFRRMRSLQKFSAVHASVHASFHNHFNQQRSLSSRDAFQLELASASSEWLGLVAT